MLARKLVIVDVKEMTDVCKKVGRIFTGESILSPIVLKRTYLLQAKPLQLATGIPASVLRRDIGFSIIPRQENAILEDGLSGGENTSNHLRVQVRTFKGWKRARRKIRIKESQRGIKTLRRHFHLTN
jgi:hypothetical protein